MLLSVIFIIGKVTVGRRRGSVVHAGDGRAI